MSLSFQQRLNVFTSLGDTMHEWAAHPVSQMGEAYVHNQWFTQEQVAYAINQWAGLLTQYKLSSWLSAYPALQQDTHHTKEIALILAGNIPLVGLHDILCVLMAGHKAIVKTSSDDSILIKKVLDTLIEIEPEMASQIVICNEALPKQFDAVIATGSNNTNRYFSYYFKNKPSLLRNSRSSAAIITGNETPEDLTKLGEDIFTYFGLGCRNVSKLFVPEGYDFNLFFQSIEPFHQLIHHHKYANNYTYHKALFLMNLEPHLDNGFLLLKEDKKMASPLSVVFYEYYSDTAGLLQRMQEEKDNLQCVVGKQALNGYIPFGKTQQPQLSDYADGEDTMLFLQGL
jgi:hypothetical protein